MKIFVGLCGRCMDGYYSSGRGESRWAQNLARCFAEAGHDVYMAPDAEECSWGACVPPSNITLLQPHKKRNLHTIHFDVAIFTSWQTRMEEAIYIHADKYVWGVMGWKQEIMKDGFFRDNDFVARWFRADLPEIPYPINFRDRCFLLAQPFGPRFHDSKFSNKTIGWVAKEAFLNTTSNHLVEISGKHLSAVLDACEETGAYLSIFSSNEFDPKIAVYLETSGLLDRIKSMHSRANLYPRLPVTEYWKELGKCSVTVPVSFAGSIQESIMYGIVPLMNKDSMFSNHPWISGVCGDKSSRDITREEISKELVRLLSDRCHHDDTLTRLRPMVSDNLDNHVLSQLNDLVNYKVSSDNVRR